MKYLTPEQILFLHARLISETGGSQGVRDLGLLASAAGRPLATFEGSELYLDIYTKAAALMDSLVQNHPLLDGNMRTGIAAAAIFLQVNGFKLIATNPEVETFMLSVSRGEREIPEIASWLENHSEITEGESSSS